MIINHQTPPTQYAAPLFFPDATTRTDWCYRAGGDDDFRSEGTLAQTCAEALDNGGDQCIEVGIAVPDLVHAPDASDLMHHCRDDLGSREFTDDEIDELIRGAIEEQLASDCVIDDYEVCYGWAERNISAEEIAPAIAAVKAVTDWEDESQHAAVNRALSALVESKTAPWYAVNPTWDLTRADAALLAHDPEQTAREREYEGRVVCEYSKWWPNPYEASCNQDAAPPTAPA